MIEVRNLVKHYGSHVAVRDLSFDVARGKVVGFLGPNGAGKSTTLRILAGFLGKTSGDVTIAGHPVDSYEAKRATGYMPEAVPLYPEMRVVEYLRFRAELKEVPRKDRASFIDDAMERANVTDVASRTIGALSKGYRQRVGLADALVAKPPLLILDEPTAGLDPNQMREVRGVIKSLGKEHTVLLSTHILSEVEASCDEVIVIAKGKLVARGTTDEIQKKRKSPGVSFTLRGDKAEVLRVLGAQASFGKVSITREGTPEGTPEGTREGTRDGADLLSVRASFKKGALDAGLVIEGAVAALALAKIQIRGVALLQSSLEDVFAELTRDGADRATDSSADTVVNAEPGAEAIAEADAKADAGARGDEERR